MEMRDLAEAHSKAGIGSMPVEMMEASRRQRRRTAASDERRLVVLTTHSERTRGEGPRRHLDVHDLPAQGEALVGRWFADDREVQTAYHERMPGPLMRSVQELRWLVSQRKALAGATEVYCLEGIHFDLLMVLAKTPVFRPRGKRVRRFAFRDRAMVKLAPLLRRSDAAFQVDYITPEQVERARAVAGLERVRLHPWKVDAEWYAPGARGEAGASGGGPLLLAGNMFRRDALVEPLLEAGFEVRRLGRHSGPRERFAETLKRPGFSLVVNAPHGEYREHLRAASAVLLPIEACDEPAGLTAALEAVACGVPVVANRSMGIAALFEACEYPLPLVEDLSGEAWVRAMGALQRRRGEPGLEARLARAQVLLREKHGILPGAGDWLETLGWQESE
jgi:hypothetical protein